MDLKKIIITGGITATLGLTGYMNAGDIKKAIECTGDEIQYEYQDNYYCGSQKEYVDDYDAFKNRISKNELKGKDDLGFGQLVIRNDEEKMEEVKGLVLAKYNPISNTFDGSQFDADILDQSFLLIEIANIACNGDCTLEGVDMTHRIYNLLTK